MTARKTKGRKSSGRTSSARSGLERFQEELPDTLRGYVREVRKRLDALERDLDRAQDRARRGAARLLREGAHRVGELEAKGESHWQRLSTNARRELVGVLDRLEKTVAPRRKTTRKKATRKTSGRKKAGQRKTARKRTGARKKAGSRS